MTFADLSCASALPPSLYLQPGHSLFSGSADEVSARFPDLPPQSIEALLGDYETENRELLEAIQQHDLESFTREISRLLEVQGASGADESMAE